MQTTLDSIKSYLLQLQQSICDALEELDGTAKFIDDQWHREEGGGGLSKVIQNGAVFRKRRREFFTRAWKITGNSEIRNSNRRLFSCNRRIHSNPSGKSFCTNYSYECSVLLHVRKCGKCYN
jgi:coproporphyrinogen III oxidase